MADTTAATSTAAGTTYEMRDGGTVTLAGTTYTVEHQVYATTGGTTTWLTGPRGAVYFLRGYRNDETGLRQVISWKSGAELRKHGNEVRAVLVGDVVEQYVPAPRAPRY